MMKKLTDLIGVCESIVVYRSSPNEKAIVVKHIMESDPSAMTCAIGDGANDINMI